MSERTERTYDGDGGERYSSADRQSSHRHSYGEGSRSSSHSGSSGSGSHGDGSHSGSSHESSSHGSSSHSGSSHGGSSHSGSSHSGSSHSGSSHSGSSHGGSSHSGSSHGGSSHSGSSHADSYHSSSSHGDGSHSGSSRSDGSDSSSRSGSSRSGSRRENVEEKHRGELIQKYQVVTDEEIEREKHHGHHRRRHHHHSRRRRIKRALIIVACIPLAIIIILSSVVSVLTLVGRSQVRKETPGIETNPFSVTFDEGRTVEYKGLTYVLNEDIVNIAAIGLDRTQFGLWGDTIGTAGQADMILIAALDLRTGLVRSLMIPRDTMTDVDLYATDGTYAGVKRMQICLSFAYGDGKETSSQNVLNSARRVLYGIPVSMYGVLDLDGIAALNDAIGGVSVTLDAPYDGHYTGDRITLHGKEAEAFVRSRDLTILESDTYRRARQIQYLRAYADKAVRAAIQDISVVGKLYNAAMEYAFTNVSLSRTMYLATTMIAKGVQISDPVVLAGHMQEGDPYSEYILDEQAVFETVLEIFYTPVGG